MRMTNQEAWEKCPVWGRFVGVIFGVLVFITLCTSIPGTVRAVKDTSYAAQDVQRDLDAAAQDAHQLEAQRHPEAY